MTKITTTDNDTKNLVEKSVIITLDELKKQLKTSSTMTVFRRLKSLGYITSYSHRGKYYTLEHIPQYDENGLWSFHSVWFSKFGNLMETIQVFIDESESGFTAVELEKIVYVSTREPLLKLYKKECIERERISGVYVYLSKDKNTRRKQILLRRNNQEYTDIGASPEIPVLSHELKAAIIMFYSLLNEKQRRLYAGLESSRLGYGGDVMIAELLGLNVHTVAKGRKELFNNDVDSERVRKEGGGRKHVEKKHPK